MEDNNKLKIVQVFLGKRRIKSAIIQRIKKYFDVELHKINIRELEKWNNEKIHLLIFDNIELKEISYAQIDKIQSVNKHIHTIVCNEFKDQKEITRFYNNHIDYVISNYYDDTLIVSILKTILKRKSAKYQIEQSLTFKNIELDIFLRELKISDQIVDTTNKEYKIIKHLLNNKEIFVSKTELFKAVWGYDEDTTRILSQYIHKIKKKLGSEVELIYAKDKGYKLI